MELLLLVMQRVAERPFRCGGGEGGWGVLWAGLAVRVLAREDCHYLAI